MLAVTFVSPLSADKIIKNGFQPGRGSGNQNISMRREKEIAHAPKGREHIQPLYGVFVKDFKSIFNSKAYFYACKCKNYFHACKCQSDDIGYCFILDFELILANSTLTIGDSFDFHWQKHLPALGNAETMLEESEKGGYYLEFQYWGEDMSNFIIKEIIPLNPLYASVYGVEQTTTPARKVEDIMSKLFDEIVNIKS